MWTPDGGVPPPDGLRSHLVVLLESGWRYDAESSRFVSDSDEALEVGGGLPEGTEIVYMMPDLQEAERESLNEHERDLTRYLHVLLPEGADTAAALAVVAAWSCVADSWLPPDVSLPGGVGL